MVAGRRGEMGVNPMNAVLNAVRAEKEEQEFVGAANEEKEGEGVDGAGGDDGASASASANARPGVLAGGSFDRHFAVL